MHLTTNTSIQIAEGSEITDSDGTRKACLMFPRGTQAEMLLPGENRQSLTQLDVRATKYTVGPKGPAAMPVKLPPTSAYTCCVELSVDQALAAGAETIKFCQPIPLYVENFLNLPVEIGVAMGFYDRQLGV